MHRWFIMVIALLIGLNCWATDGPVEYEIDVELDPATHLLRGAEHIRWTNTADAATDELWFHLYLNAFANDRTTFMKGIDGGTLRGRRSVERHWGWTRILSLQTKDGADLLPALTFERPDDGDPEDFTVARVRLPEPVEPGASVVVDLEFEAQLPRVIARTGWAGDFHLVGQWFPKLGVYEPAGHGGRETAGWNCHQFHPATEFYADFGRYRVRITVPENFVVGATGVLLDETAVAEGTSRKRTVTFTADAVHDFAWCTAPGDLMEVVESEFDPGRDVPGVWLERARDLLDLSTADLELPPVHLRLLVPRTQKKLSDRMIRGARLGIAWYGLFYGPYPYPQLTMVSPPPTAEEAAGMEYPTFITTGASKLMEYPPLKWLSLNETVTVHEFGHQYFQGMLASNEFEQAWLDEGLNSYAETSCMAAIKNDRLVPEIRLSNPWASKRAPWSSRRAPLRIDRRAWEFRTRRDYGTASYDKTTLALKTLEGLLGPEVFARAMRAYVEAWRFRHPTGADFFAAVSESSGRDLDWFFRQAFEGDAVVDWAVEEVHQRPNEKPDGMVWSEGTWIEPPVDCGEDDGSVGEGSPGEENEGRWSVTVDIVRHGDFQGPVGILFQFENGREERRTWDGTARWTRFEFSESDRLQSVVVDPDGVWALEGARRNNYWRAKPDDHLFKRRFWWFGPAVHALTLGIEPWS